MLARFGSARIRQADRSEFCWNLNASHLMLQKSSGLEPHKRTFGQSTVVRAVVFTRTICFDLLSACSTLLQILALIYILHGFVYLLRWNDISFFFPECFESSCKGQQAKPRNDPKKRLIGLFTQNLGPFMLSYAKLPQQVLLVLESRVIFYG